MTRTRSYYTKALEVIGTAIQPNYFYVEEKESEATSCVSSEADGLLNMLKKLEFIFEIDRDDNCLGKGDNEGKKTGTHKIKIELDAVTELKYDNSLDVTDSTPDICITQIESDSLTEPDCYTDVETSSCMAEIELDAMSKSNCDGYLSNVSETRSNLTHRESDAFTEPDSEPDGGCSDTNTNVEAMIYMARMILDAMIIPVYCDCLKASSDFETNSYIAKIKLDAMTEPNGHCMDASSDVNKIDYVGQVEVDAMRKPHYGNCLDANLDVKARKNRVKLEVDAFTEPDGSDCLDGISDMEANGYMAQIEFDPDEGTKSYKAKI